MVQTHYDVFPEAERGEINDGYWISDVTARGWVIITRNGAIRRNPLEREAFIRAGASVFNIRNGQATAAEVVGAFSKATNKMSEILKNTKPPFIAGISLSGDVTFIDAPR
jgi:hypothetical protein